MRSIRIAFLGLLPLAAACNTTAKAMDSWMGRPDSELVSAWGAPARSITLSNGQRVMTWEKLWTYQGQREVCEESFTVSPGGAVVKWAANNCPRW